jgi:hypothetical protein
MGRYEDTIANNSRFSLDDAFDDAESDYRDDFMDYWGFESQAPPTDLDHDDWLEYRKIYGLATQIAEAASTLLQRKGLGTDRLALPQLLAQEAAGTQEEVTKFLAAVKQHQPDAWAKAYQLLLPYHPADPRTKYNVFRNTLQLEAARLFPSWPGKLADRLQVLVAYLVRYPNARTASYLARVATCYVREMRPEFAVMARAVLDTALEEFVEDATVRELVGANRHVGLERRIEYCSATGVFDKDATAAATLVREAGDDAIHTAPGLEPDLESLLAALVTTLTSIEKSRKNP